jgi:hypothetical protein
MKESESELLYGWRFTANQFVLATSPLRLTTSNFIFQLNTCGYIPYVISSLTRGWVCRLQLLLILASAYILRSESRGTHDHILLSQIRDSPNLESVRVRVTLRLTVSQSVSQSILVSSLVWGSWPGISYCLTGTVLSLGGGALSNERTGLSFVRVNSIKSIVSMYNYLYFTCFTWY